MNRILNHISEIKRRKIFAFTHVTYDFKFISWSHISKDLPVLGQYFRGYGISNSRYETWLLVSGASSLSD